MNGSGGKKEVDFITPSISDFHRNCLHHDFPRKVIQLKQQLAALTAALLIGISFPVMAEETNPTPPEPAATNMETPYPSVDGCLPPEPVPPANGVKDYENFQKYVNAVNAYIKAAQAYIDGATNDANDIIRKRNEAVEKTQRIVDTYNASLPKENKKS